MKRIKRISLKKAFGFCAGATLLLASCSPETPGNEIKNKLHEDPVRAVFTLQEGTLNGEGKFDNQPKAADFKGDNAKVQTIEYKTSKTEGWHITSAAKSFDVKNTIDHPNVVYRLKIEYFNADNQPMNMQFFNQGQDKIHQHFFAMYKKIKSEAGLSDVRVNKKEELCYDYRYADELNGSYIGDTNPMGFDGFFKFTKPGKNFELSVELLHASQSKYDAEGKTSPFYLPSRILRSTGQWDISVKLPVNIDGVPTGDDDNPSLDASLFAPDKVEVHIYDGHIHKPYNFHQNFHPKENKYLGMVYKLVYKLENNQWKAADTNPKWVGALSSKGIYEGCVYAFDIHYFKGDTEITGQLFDNDENKHYQHFFMANDIVEGLGGKKEATDKNSTDFFEYVYRDTTPWNQTNHFNHAPYAEEEKQIGLKGFFLFKHPYKKFNLDIKLMRARGSKLVKGKPSPFYAPTADQLSDEAWMPVIRIPMYLYMDNEDKDIDAELDKEESEYSAHEKNVIRAMMEAFDIKEFKSAAAEFYWNMEGNVDPEFASFWF